MARVYATLTTEAVLPDVVGILRGHLNSERARGGTFVATQLPAMLHNSQEARTPKRTLTQRHQHKTTYADLGFEIFGVEIMPCGV